VCQLVNRRPNHQCNHLTSPQHSHHHFLLASHHLDLHRSPAVFQQCSLVLNHHRSLVLNLPRSRLVNQLRNHL
jgi:hypothetical protein